jgi:hypothetical protein
VSRIKNVAHSIIDDVSDLKNILVFCRCRSSVDISADGSTLAIGSINNVLALTWNGTHYKQYLNNITSDDVWTTVSLSRDGNALAVGNLYSENNGEGGGVTTVYKVRPCCTGNTKLLRISFTTGNYPDENRWTLHIGNETIESQPFDGLPLMTFVEEICVPADVCVKFRVFDTAGDGIQFPGGYSVMLDGEEVASGGSDFSSVVTKHITGDCPTLCTGTTPDWVDGVGDECDWYERNDVPGCEVDGESYPAEDGSTAKDNCCYCFPVANNPMPSPAITYSAFPTASTLQTKPPTKTSFLTQFDELTTATENNEDGSN